MPSQGSNFPDASSTRRLLHNPPTLLTDWPGMPPCAGLDKCRELNTLVLSHNAVGSLGTWVGSANKLEKMSLSHNKLQELGGALK